MQQNNYYAGKLHSQKLFQVYDTKIPRVTRYLDAEINFVRSALRGRETVLELGAGYGRIVKALAPHCASITGIDISEDSILLSKEYLKDIPNANMITMDIHKIDIKDSYDVVLCLQNGLSAMRATRRTIDGMMGLAAHGGRIFFSSYSPKFWYFRLRWFQEQAAKGVLGEVDLDQSKNGVIVCADGFKATTHSPKDFEEIGIASGYPFQIREIDDSSIFLILHKT